MNYYLYGGHGLCMGWYGVTDGAAGMMALVETPDDAAVRIPRQAGLLGFASAGNRRRDSSAVRGESGTCSSTPAATWRCASAIAAMPRRPAIW